jgi:hypothetical protein
LKSVVEEYGKGAWLRSIVKAWLRSMVEEYG